VVALAVERGVGQLLSIMVAIDGRGRYVGGRVIDLSKAAAQRLGIVEDGLAKVRIEATPRQLALAER
jgi:rare lipoprotein A